MDKFYVFSGIVIALVFALAGFGIHAAIKREIVATQWCREHGYDRTVSVGRTSHTFCVDPKTHQVYDPLND